VRTLLPSLSERIEMVSMSARGAECRPSHDGLVALTGALIRAAPEVADLQHDVSAQPRTSSTCSTHLLVDLLHLDRMVAHDGTATCQRVCSKDNLHPPLFSSH